MKISLLPFLCAFWAADAFVLIAPESSWKSWTDDAALERAKGFTKEIKNQFSTRIIGGGSAPPARYPYYTLVEIKVNTGDTYICSASLIWEDVLLTAAHCVVDILGGGFTIDNVQAFVGLERQDLRDDAQNRQVGVSVPHPAYKAGSEVNDIMLLKLDIPVTTIAPVKLNFDAAVPADGAGVDVFGFGATSTDPNATLPTILQKVSLSVVPYSDCNDVNSFNGAINQTVMMCAGTAAGGKVSYIYRFVNHDTIGCQLDSDACCHCC